MFNFANIDINRIVTAAVGALVLSTFCVGAAIAPAGAVEAGVVAQAEGASAGTLNA